MSISEKEIEILDKTDPLKTSAQAFNLPDGMIYLDGNSLGAMPKAVVERLQDVVIREWAEQLIHSWNDNNWFVLSQTIGDKIAKLVGASPGEVVVSDCVSVNLFKLVVAALKKQKGKRKIVTELGNFPTNLYVMQGIARMFDDEVEVVAVERAELMDAIDDETAIVVLIHVHYKSSEALDMDAFTSKAHENGALILWDLCHSAGVMPIELNGCDVDLAVGCGYKYLNGGPGSPAFLYVKESLQLDLQQPLSGWWGHAEPFAFDDLYKPAGDIRRMQSGTQSVLGLSALEVGIDTALSVEMGDVRDKSQKLGRLFIELVEQFCPELIIASPQDDTLRGSHVSIQHEQGYAITSALSAINIIVDFRAPDIIRFGFAPLYTSYQDIWSTVTSLEQIIRTEAWDKDEYKEKSTVT
jgi:kynureninase